LFNTSNQKDPVQDVDVPYQKWRGVVFPGQGKPLHGDKSLDGELWNGHWEKLGFQIQIQVLPGVFQNVLPNQGEAFIVTATVAWIFSLASGIVPFHPTGLRMGEEGNIQHPPHAKVLVHGP